MNGHQNIDAVLWDMDGTLIDSEHLHYEVIAWQCRREGFEWSLQDNEHILGATMDEKWRQLNLRHTFSASRDHWLEEFNREYERRLKPELGLGTRVETVKRLERLGVPMACVSNGERSVVQANLAVLNLEHCFQVIVANGDCQHGKPFPDPYRLACERLGKQPERCIAVEDSVVGVRAALASNMVTVVWPQDGNAWTGPSVDHVVVEDAFPWHLLGEQIK